MFVKLIKPCFDFLFSFIVLIFLSPILFLIYIILFFQTKRNPVFFQTRIGKDEVPFQLFKFKTMSDQVDLNGNLLPDNQRISPLGKWLRSNSLDELPQLFNILNGKMSLIGPRPLLPEYLPLYNFEQRQRHKVKPGLTGWAQVNGRNAISWQEKFSFDIWYVEHISFKIDAIIFFKTLIKILDKRDINSSADIPMEKFSGN